MPLPDVALEGRFGIELELMHVDLFAEQLAQRLDHPRMAGEQAERLVEGVRGKGGARRAGLLAPHFLAVEFQDRLGIVAQQRDFFLAKTVREEQIALLVEFFQLTGR